MRHQLLAPDRIRSPVHRLPAGLKLAVALAIVTVTVGMRRDAWPWFAGLGLALVAAAGLARLPFGFVARRLVMLEPFVLGVSLLALLQPHGTTVFAGLLSRSTLCLLTMIVLTSTTSVADLLRVLRHLRVPAILVTTLALLSRYLFVLADESQRQGRARASRTLVPSRRRDWRLLGTSLGMLFVRASGRAERVYAAMLSRGWQ